MQSWGDKLYFRLRQQRLVAIKFEVSLTLEKRTNLVIPWWQWCVESQEKPEGVDEHAAAGHN